MARKSELLYWTGSRWANAKFRHWDVGESPDAWMDNYESDGTDSNPVMSLRLEEKIGNPRSAVLTISNTPRNASSAAANEKKGRFTGVFTDFQNVRLRDGDTGTILFAGKIYNMQEKYDVVLGNIIVLTLRDNLEELKNYKIGTWVDNPLAYTTGSRVSSDIATIIDNVAYLDSDSISFSNTDKYEASATQYDQAGNIEFPGNSTVLKAVSNLAKKDPHEDGATDDFGYDYLVDPAVVTSATDTAAPSADWNYFKRGTRPSTAPETYGLSIKYPKPSNFAKDGYNTRMMNDFDFEEPKAEIYSDVVLTYRDRHLQLEGGVEATDGSQGAADQVVTKRFERIDVTFTNDGAFTGATYPIGQGELLTFTPDGGGAAQFAKFEYQSVIRSGTNVTGFIIVSPLIASPSFNANFPEAVGTITGVTSGKTATTTATCRVAKNFGVRKSKAVKSVDTLDPQKIRQEIASYLSRNTTVIKRGAYKVANYPYHYIDAQASKVSRSNGTVSFTTGAFATNGGSATNNPELFGVHVGDVIVELDATATTITRYAYISSTGSSSVVYGGDTATQTSDGTALDATKPMRIYIPLRPGHIAQVTNSLVDVSGTHLITYLNYEEKDGVSFTEIASVGKNDSAALKPNIFDTLVDGVESYGDTDPTKGTNIANVKSWTFTGTATATDSDTVAWTAGKLYDDAGSVVYSISSGDTGNMSAESIVYFDVVANSTIFSTSTKATYVEKVNRVKVLAANNSDTAEGSQATFSYLTPVSGFSTTGAQVLLATNALANASMTSTLAKKGMQGWATDIIFEGTDWDDIKWHKVDASDSTSGNVSFSDNVEEAITYGSKTFSGDDLGKTVYCYKTVGDSPSATLVFTRDYTDLYTDSRILMATFVVAGSDDNTGSPSIFPFNGSQPTVSAGLISAGAITASNIQANTITADEINTDAITANELIAGAITSKHTITGAIVQTDAGANTGVKMISASSALRIYEGNLEFYTSDGYPRGSLRAQNFTWADSTVRPGISVYGPSTSSLSSPTIANLALFGHQVGNSSQTYDAVSGQTANTSMLVYGSAELKGTSGNYSRLFFTDSSAAPQGALYVAGGVPINMPADLETKQRMLVMGNDNALADYWAFDVADSSSAYRKFMYPSNATSDGTVGDSYSYIGSYDNSGTWTSRPLTGLQSYYLWGGEGTNAAPSHSFTGDADTGMYRVGANIIGFATAGTARWSIGTGGDFVPATDGSGGSGFDIGSSSYEVDKFYGYTIYFSNSASTSGTDLIVTASGQIAKKSSSIQYKDNVKELVYDSSKLDKLRPVSYDYKLDNAPDIGLIAEEVNEIYPELINYDKEGKAESIKYHGLSVMLLEEMKNLRKEINELKGKN